MFSDLELYSEAPGHVFMRRLNPKSSTRENACKSKQIISAINLFIGMVRVSFELNFFSLSAILVIFNGFDLIFNGLGKL